VVNVGQEPGSILRTALARADISINSYESRIERATGCVLCRCRVHPRAFYSQGDMNANKIRY